MTLLLKTRQNERLKMASRGNQNFSTMGLKLQVMVREP